MPKDYDTKKINQYYKARSENPYLNIEIEGHLNISVDVIRELKNEAKYAPHEAIKRFFVISDADKFSRETANTFLKLLEEPPESLQIILITDQYHSLLDTIKSRCQPVYFPKFSEDEITGLVLKYSTQKSYSKEDILTSTLLAKHNVKKIFEYLDSDYSEWLDWVYQYLIATTGFNMMDLSSLIDKVSNRKKKNMTGELLDLIIAWLMDSYHVQVFGDIDQIVLKQYSENIQKFADFTSEVDYNHCINLVETARDNIRRNAQIPLQLTTLAIQLNEIFSNARRVSKEAV
jgi:DNA polymerase-3 subunit delta'